ncbi:hypothetical protein D3C87_1569430 [compost metagenome]
MDILVDPEAGDRIAQQRDCSLIVGVHAHKGAGVSAADGADVPEPVRQSLHRGAESLDQRVGIPGVRFLALEHKSAAAIALCHRLVGVGAGRMLDAMLAGARIDLEFEMISVQRQNLLALVLVQTENVGFGVRRQSQILLFIGLQISPP